MIKASIGAALCFLIQGSKIVIPEMISRRLSEYEAEATQFILRLTAFLKKPYGKFSSAVL